MATIAFAKGSFNGEGDVWTATVSTGDQTSVLTLTEGQENVSFLATGTIGGSTVTVQQTLDGTNFGTAEASDGTALIQTTIGLVKQVLSAGIGLRAVVTAGAAAGLVISVYVPRKVR